MVPPVSVPQVSTLLPSSFVAATLSEVVILLLAYLMRKRENVFVSLYLQFAFFPQEKSLPGVVMALVCNVFDMLYQLANLEEPR